MMKVPHSIKYRLFLSFFIVLIGVENMYPQQDPNYVLYRYTMNTINPAYAGSDGLTSFTFNHRSQWQGVEGAPRTQTFIGSTILNERTGLGLTVVNDQTFIERQTAIFIDFSYKLQVGEEINLFLGLKAGGNFFDVNANGLQTFNATIDPLLQDDSRFNPNIGIGFLVQHEHYFASLSTPRILSTERFEERNDIVTEATDELHLFLAGGYNFGLSENWFFKPSFLMRYVEGTPLSADITAALEYNKKIEFGVVYRTDSAISALALITIADWFKAGYAFDSSLRSELSQGNNGTHEVLLKFTIPEN